jgi:hypothetical protein
MPDFTFSPFPSGPTVDKDGSANAGTRGYFGQFDLSPASILLGRGNDVTKDIGTLQRITLGTGLSLDGTVLSAVDLYGDVTGPASAVSGHLASFDGVTGKVIADSGVLASWFNQALLTGSTPTFAGAILGTLSVNGFTVTVSGAPTLNNWFDQSVKIAASPTFAGITAGGAAFTTMSVNGSTFTVNGAPTLDNWFDQSVKTGASPSFAGLTVNSFAFTVNGAPTLNDWFNQSVKTSANPTFNKITSSNEIVATSFFAVGGNLGGGPHTGLQVALTAGGTLLNFDIIGGILTNTSVTV